MSSVLSPADEKVIGESAAAAVPQKKPAGKEDDICVDNWEQLDQQKIQKSLQSMKQNSGKPGVGEADDESTSRNKAAPNQPITILTSNSNNNTQYPPQSIKILKRPASDKRLNDMANPNQNNNQQPQPPPIKTFEQREQEYAQARLRILGSAHPDEDYANASSTSATNTGMRSVSSQQDFNNSGRTNRPPI